MNRHLRFLFAGLLLSQSLLLGSDLIERKPYTEWTKKDVSQILNTSLWVKLSPAGVDTPAFFMVRLLTAKPIREAWLRVLELQPVISAKELSANNSSAEKKAVLERYLASHPDDGANLKRLKTTVHR